MGRMLAVGGEALEESDDAEVDYLDSYHDDLEQWYLSIMVEPEFINFPKRRLHVTMDAYMPAIFGSKFRFRSKEDMLRLLNVWRLPERIYLEDGTVVSSEFVMLFSIRRLATHTNLDDFAQFEFGREYSTLSRIFKFFVLFTFNTFAQKLSNNLPFFVDKFPDYAEAIRLKMNERGGANIAAGNFAISSFIDCKITSVARTGGGPAGHGGPNAERNDPHLQQAMYNRWARRHGIKNQSVEFPCGLSGDMWGPGSCRHNDLWLLFESDINNKMAAAQEGSPLQYFMYGDAIYPRRSHLRSRHGPQGGVLFDPELRAQDRGMTACREAVEWSFQEADLLFPFMTYKEKMKARGMPLREIYFTKCLLRNCYNCLYHSKASKFFGCPPPTLEEYMD